MSNRQSRIQIDVSEELKMRFNQVFPWGAWNSIGVKMIEWICDLHDEFGEAAFLAFYRGDFHKLIKADLEEFVRKNSLDAKEK